MATPNRTPNPKSFAPKATRRTDPNGKGYLTVRVRRTRDFVDKNPVLGRELVSMPPLKKAPTRSFKKP